VKIEFLWFDDCPNHEAARSLLLSVLHEQEINVSVEDIDASDPNEANRLRFPGSPSIRIDGIDIEPGFVDPEEYTPRCRIYFTSTGMAGVPERSWVEQALAAAERG
jgi:hypothetical protein